MTTGRPSVSSYDKRQEPTLGARQELTFGYTVRKA